MPDSKSHYHILQVESSADLSVIKRAYRQQVRRFHPDQYVAERVRLKQAGDMVALHKLEAEIERAKHMTQRINEAYGVLSDPARRELYDRSLSHARQQQYQAQMRQQRARYDADDGRRTVKTRQHRPPAQPKDDKLPWAILVGFIGVLLFATAAFSSFLSGMQTPLRAYVPDNPTAQGVITSRQLQATSIAEEATSAARMTQAALPTATPRTLEANVRAAQNLYDLGIYDHALDLYNRAISEAPDDATLYLQRGKTYMALFVAGDVQAADAAQADFEAALLRQADPLPVQRERGLLYFLRWQMTNSADHAEAALVDLRAYRASDPEDGMVYAALLVLESSGASGNRQGN